jgi:hypothetical protein
MTVKKIRSWGTVEHRPSGRWRARTSKDEGWKNIGHYDTKEQAERALEDYKKREGIEVDEQIDDVVGQDSKPFAEVSRDEVTISTGVISEPVTNWDKILISFGLDPDVFEVVDDKVRMSKWQTSKRLESGERDLIWLYSYKALFKHRKQPKLKDEDLTAIRRTIKTFKPKKQQQVTGDPSTFLILWADWQLAKSASGGVAATVARVLESYDRCTKRINELYKSGRNIERIAFVNMGDPIEGCSDFYSSQTFSVELNQRQQLLLALDLWVKGIETLAPLAPKATFISTLSNHGEWTRKGSRAITTDSDSADAFLADALSRILKDKGYIDEWHIPHDEMTMQVNLSGLECAFTHGHKITGKELEWLRGQSMRLLRENGAEPRMWFTAHKHHFRAHDFGAFNLFQCPSLDTDGSPSGGSKWFSDISGQWSSPGVLTMLVGSHDRRGFSDIAIL